MLHIPSFVKNLQTYVPGKPLNELSNSIPLDKYIRFASNENPRGPSPLAQKAIRLAIKELNRYSDPASRDLVSTISEIYNIPKNQIICGHGTDSILASIVSAFTHENDEILTSEGTFIGIYVNVQKLGRKIIKTPLKNYAYDLQAILKAVSKKTKMVYISNPNNPTGSLVGKKELESFMKKLPKNILVVLDEAYTQYAEHLEEYPNGLHCKYENMVVTRSLSKAYGLAGLRIGFAVGSGQVIETLYKVKLPFDPGLLPQRAAVAALKDTDFLKKTVQLNRASLDILLTCLKTLGIKHKGTAANFVMAIFGSANEAREFNDNCLARGLVLRPLTTFGIPEAIRISSGTLAESKRAAQIIKSVYEKLKN